MFSVYSVLDLISMVMSCSAKKALIEKPYDKKIVKTTREKIELEPLALS